MGLDRFIGTNLAHPAAQAGVRVLKIIYIV
jgi:hypothetical protein